MSPPGEQKPENHLHSIPSGVRDTGRFPHRDDNLFRFVGPGRAEEGEGDWVRGGSGIEGHRVPLQGTLSSEETKGHNAHTLCGPWGSSREKVRDSGGEEVPSTGTRAEQTSLRLPWVSETTWMGLQLALLS